MEQPLDLTKTNSKNPFTIEYLNIKYSLSKTKTNTITFIRK